MGWLWTTKADRLKALQRDLAVAWADVSRRFDQQHDNTQKVLNVLKKIYERQGLIMATQQELADQLTATKAQLDKALGEINAKISDLSAAISNQSNVTPELQAAFDALKVSAQALDDVVPG